MMYDEIKNKVNKGESLTEAENRFLFEFMDYLESEEQKKEVQKILVLGNLGLMIHFLKSFTYNNEDFDDIKQVASLGLIHAVKNFKKEKGCAFSSFAFPVIKNHICTALNKKNHNCNNSKKNQKQKTIKKPYIEIRSFNESYCQDVRSDFDLESCILEKERMEMVKDAMDILNEEERVLIQERFLCNEGFTYEELAKKHHTNLSRVYRTIQKAIKKMEKFLKERNYEY